MAIVPIHQTLVGAAFNATEVEYQRSNTELSLVGSGDAWDTSDGLILDALLDDETNNTIIVDSSPTANNGILGVNTDTISTTGLITTGKAFDVTGLSPYFVDNSAYNYTNFSMSIWIKPVSVAGTQYFASKYKSGASEWLMGIISSGKIVLYMSSDGSTITTLTTDSIVLSAGVKAHIVMSYEVGGVVILYVNGTAVATSGTTPTTVFNGNARVQFNSYDGGGNPLNGIVDRFTLWNRVIIQDEVDAFYNNGDGTQELPNNTSFPMSTEITLDIIDSTVDDTPWDYSSIDELLVNPNGEAGTALFKWAVGNSLPLTYNSTWLTLTELKAVSNLLTIGRYNGFKEQFSGDGSQDVTTTNFFLDADILCVQTYVDADNLLLGVDRGDGVFGTRRDALEADVKFGEVFGPNDTFTGTYVPTCDFPSEDDVVLDVDYDNGNLTGNNRQVPTNKAENGFVYGPSDSLTGGLESVTLTKDTFEIIIGRSPIEVEIA